ncbi:hypothetical protein [Thauera sp. WH-1]|uniref:hypothetical protein n=1 Tax=Thauera sp. WH-1 TaxID=3398230 RepID=UPI0039FDB0FF
MEKILSLTRRKALYFFVLSALALGFSAVHWISNPYRMATWIDSADTAHIVIDARCRDGLGALRHRQVVTAGYHEYRLPLPRCELASVSLRSDNKTSIAQSVSLTAITYYGKRVSTLRGPERRLGGEGIFARDTRPSRKDSLPISQPQVWDVSNIDTRVARVIWPRWAFVLLIPLCWLAAHYLASNRAYAGPQTSHCDIWIGLSLVALTLVTTMTLVARTDVSVHPDELSHVGSAHYYFDHWVKPRIGSPETLEAHRTNRYGVAYMTGTDPVYLMAAKFAVAVWPLVQNDVVALRLFNVALLGLLVFGAAFSLQVRIGVIPLLFVPQAWYVFSYFNGDALPLFLAVLVMVGAMRLGQRVRAGSSAGGTRMLALLVGACAGLLLLSKPNYWVVFGVIFLLYVAEMERMPTKRFITLALGWIVALSGVFLLLDTRRSEDSSAIAEILILLGLLLVAWPMTTVLRCLFTTLAQNVRARNTLCIFVGAASIVIFMKMIDESWNNPLPLTSERSSILSAAIESNASPAFKPSSIGDGQASKNFHLYEQGVSLTEVLTEREWFSWSLRSFAGVYGYLNIGPPAFFSYLVIALIIGTWVVIFALSGRVGCQSPSRGRVQLAMAVGIFTVLSAAIGFSWLYDFQPQGRYLLPILPFLSGGLALSNRRILENTHLTKAVSLGVLISSASFLLIALSGIPKSPGLY